MCQEFVECGLDGCIVLRSTVDGDSWTGDETIVARVTGLSGTSLNASAKAGVMFRNTTDAGLLQYGGQRALPHDHAVISRAQRKLRPYPAGRANPPDSQCRR